MSRKRKQSQTNTSYNHVPIRGFVAGLIIFIILMILFRNFFLRTNIPLIYFIACSAALGWLIGWGIKFHSAPKRYTTKGISLSLAQFILSIVNILFFTISVVFYVCLFFLMVATVKHFNIEIIDPILATFIFIVPFGLWGLTFAIAGTKLGTLMSQRLGMSAEEYRKTMRGVHEI